jgi:predicted Rossmann fold nucleotide-binding protein DprA/Smf involved in DNA uptake
MLEKYEKPKAKPAKAKAVKKVAAKKAAPKKAVPKKAKPATAADTVLAIINRYKKGVNNAALMEKTGYNQKKISNLVFKLRKQGKIKSVAKGVYVKA